MYQVKRSDERVVLPSWNSN